MSNSLTAPGVSAAPSQSHVASSSAHNPCSSLQMPLSSALAPLNNLRCVVVIGSASTGRQGVRVERGAVTLLVWNRCLNLQQLHGQSKVSCHTVHSASTLLLCAHCLTVRSLPHCALTILLCSQCFIASLCSHHLCPLLLYSHCALTILVC